MRRLLSIHYSAAAFNIGLLLLRLVSGALIMHHGYQKLLKFSSMKDGFYNFLGLGGPTALSMTIFAEFFCGLFVLIGLFTRLTVIPLIVVMAIALFKIHHSDFLGEGELAAMYLAAFLTILLVGPGKISVDGLAGK